jgi:hypothetical protein
MGGQTAFGFYDNDTKLVSYYFMGDYALDAIESYVLQPYNVLYDSAKPLFEGWCLIEEFKSSAFQNEHDLVAAVVIMPGSIVCYKPKSISIIKKRICSVQDSV